MVKPQFGKALASLPAGLKYYVENGQKADSGQLDFSQVKAVPA